MAKTKRELAAYAKTTQLRVEKAFKELLPDVTLVKVLTEAKRDWEGDDVVDIRVVFDGVERLDIDKTLKLRDRIWMQRDYENDDPIPLFDFTPLSVMKENNLAL